MLFDHWYALDIGACNSRFYDFSTKEQTELKTVVAWKKNQPIATGQDALSYLYKNEAVTIKHPLDHQQVLSSFAPVIQDGLKALGQDQNLFQPHILAAVPTHMEMRYFDQWHDELIKAGISKIDFVSVMDLLQTEEPSLLIHSGHSYTELAVYAHGHEYVHKTIYFAGRQVDEAVVQYIAEKTNCIITIEDACTLKEMASEQLKQSNNAILRCTAKNLFQEYVQLEVRCMELWPCMEGVIKQIVLWAKQCLEPLSIEMKENIYQNGVVLSGGMASCFGMVQTLEMALNQPVICNQDPYLDILNTMKGWR